MKKVGILNTTVVAFAGLLFSSLPVWAQWTEPEFLGELNASNCYAFLPRVLDNGSMIYFLRDTPERGYVLFEARFDNITGLYSQQRIVGELGTQGGSIPSFWISIDGLRMYYAEAIFIGNQWQRVLRFADRISTDQPWKYRKNFMELHKDILDTSVSLTADELTIIWTSKPLTKAGVYYQATRTSVSQPFGTARILTELSPSMGEEIYLSPDGLTIYFERRTGNRTLEMWKGIRPTINDTFGNFEPITDINQLGPWTGNPCVSSDQQMIWFLQRRGEAVNLSSTGIYVSQWIETPYEKTMRNLLEAYQLKQESLQNINMAIEKEKEAIGFLLEMLKTELPEGLTKKDISKSRLAILHAICRQAIAECGLKMSLKELQKGISILDPNALDPQ